MTLMEQEAREASQRIRQQFAENASRWQAVLAKLASHPVTHAMTIARGSSDHAAMFAKYLFEVQLGLVTASAAPSVVSVYHADLSLRQTLVVGLSQSGQSPDIVAMMQQARAAGAVTVALVNQEDSPLAEAAEFVIPLYAGEERAVAATKSYLCTLAALAQFVSLYQQDAALEQALTQLPAALHAATMCDWSAAHKIFLPSQDAFMVGRGYGFAIALEAALKGKETAGIHAEAFSSAEVLHGPFALVKKDFPVMVFAQPDATWQGTLSLAQRMQDMGVKVVLAAPADQSVPEALCAMLVPVPNIVHPVLDPLVQVQAFYIWMAQLSVARGFNPDQPVNLNKVTETQ